MRNLLQEQLLKAGLVKKSKVAEVVREQNRQRKAKGTSADASTPAQVDADKLRAERAERDRALAAERNAQLRANEIRAQIRQLIEHHRVRRDGESAYRFSDGGAIRQILIDDAQRAQLAKGTLVIARLDDSYELLPRAAAGKVRERDVQVIVVDHGDTTSASSEDELDEHYRKFQVPDDLIW